MNNNNIKSENETPKSNKNDRGNTFNIIKEGWDKLSLEYDSIVKNVNSFNDSLDEEHKNIFKPIITSLEKFKDNFKNVIFNISLSIGNISSNSPSKNNEMNINLSVKDSYDNIYNEFLELESLTKKMTTNQIKMQKNRNAHFQNIEKKLQGYLEEINEFDFKKINKNYQKFSNDLNHLNDNEKINILLQNNDIVEKYNPFEFNFNESENIKIEDEGEFEEEYDFDNIIEKNDILKKKNKIIEEKKNKENSANNEEKDAKMLNEIINMDGINPDEAVKYIKFLINKDKNSNDKY